MASVVRRSAVSCLLRSLDWFVQIDDCTDASQVSYRGWLKKFHFATVSLPHTFSLIFGLQNFGLCLFSGLLMLLHYHFHPPLHSFSLFSVSFSDYINTEGEPLGSLLYDNVQQDGVLRKCAYGATNFDVCCVFKYCGQTYNWVIPSCPSELLVIFLLSLPAGIVPVIGVLSCAQRYRRSIANSRKQPRGSAVLILYPTNKMAMAQNLTAFLVKVR